MFYSLVAAVTAEQVGAERLEKYLSETERSKSNGSGWRGWKHVRNISRTINSSLQAPKGSALSDK